MLKKGSKVKNATSEEYDSIIFKSKLEKMIYSTLKEAGFPVEYEPKKFILWEGFRPTVPFYDKDKVTRMLKLNNKKLISISYTPDFVFRYNDHLIVIEGKGIENDRFFIYKKLFRAWLEKNEPKSLYFEVYTKKQVLQAINIIKKIEDDGNRELQEN